VLREVFNSLCKSSSESGKSTWSSANNSVLSIVSSFISIPVQCICDIVRNYNERVSSSHTQNNNLCVFTPVGFDLVITCLEVQRTTLLAKLHLTLGL